MRRVAAIASVALGLTACTHRQQLPASGEGLDVGDQVAARTTGGEDVDGTIVKGPLGGYRVRVHQPRRELELTELKTISRKSAGRGALDGLLIGVAAGALFGAVLAGITYEEPGGFVADTRGEAILLNAAGWGGIGVLVGAIGGAVGEATYEYQLPARP